MTEVRYPYMRREVILAIAHVADTEYQDRVWIRLEMPFERYYDSLDEAVHWLFDDLLILPDPGDADGDVLLPGVEVSRLKSLGPEFDSMITRLGDVPDIQYLRDEQWPGVVALAEKCLPALILARGWECVETDAKAFAESRAEGRIPTVALPATRRRVIKAVAALADDEFQRRTWPGGTDTALGDDVPADPVTSAGTVTSADPVTADLDACLRTLTADTHVLPDPTDAIGRVLLPGDEIDRIAALGAALEPFHRNDTAPPWDTPAWSTVVTAALHCLPALVIAGAWIGPDGDPASATARSPKKA